MGSNLAAHALSEGIELCVFDNLYRRGSRDNLKWLIEKGEFTFVHGDIRNSNDVQRVIARMRPDAIFHLAGQVAMTSSIADPRMDFEVNALGTLNVLEAVRSNSPNALVIYSSTNKVYGDLEKYQYRETDTRYICIEHQLGFDEQTPLEFHSPYGCSKGAADQYLMDYHRIFGLKTVVFRHSSMYGGRQFATEDQGWIGWFCQMAAETRMGRRIIPFTISGNGKQVRDVLYVEDMISLYFTTLKAGDAAVGNAFNIGGGVTNSLSLLELFKLLESAIDQPLRYRMQPPRESDQRVFIADIRKIQRLTGWVPSVSTKTGILSMLEWISAIDTNIG